MILTFQVMAFISQPISSQEEYVSAASGAHQGQVRSRFLGSFCTMSVSLEKEGKLRNVDS